MDRDAYLVAVVLGTTVLLAALLPMAATARPANEIPVEHMPADGDALADPGGDAWGEVPSVKVPLSSAPSSVPGADETSVERVTVQAATTSDRIYLRLTWADGTADTSDGSVRTFSDAAAVQLPVNASVRPAIAMGSSRNLVNVWYWSGSGGGQELLAGGAGSTTTIGNVTTAQRHENGRWEVVYTRSLAGSTENQTTIPARRDVDVAFAVWNGSEMERSGRKAVSEWHYLALGPGPGGPPYEALLWSVAGLAVVFVVAVTAHAVWQTRGEAGGEPDV